ncbi:MAG TPA: DUF1289 domain-containing protein [Rhodocyclaceae bacterium]
MTPASPCIGLCQIAPAGDICQGCYRTLDEISRWRHMSSEEQERILSRLAADKETRPAAAS